MKAVEEDHDEAAPPAVAPPIPSPPSPAQPSQRLPTQQPALPTPSSTPEPANRTGISCPSCGGDLPGRFAKCVHCRSDIFWSTNGLGFSQQSHAQAHDAECRAREEQVATDRIASYRRERTKSVLQKLTGALNIAAPLNLDKSSPKTALNSAELNRLKAVIADGLKHAEDFQHEMRAWDTSEPPQDERRYDEPLPPALPPDLQVAHEKLLQLCNVAEELLATRSANTSIKQAHSTPAEVQESDCHDDRDNCGTEDALDPALWQWVMTATACVAAADGKLGQLELDAIAQTLVAHGCPLAGESLRQEIISTCKHVHREGTAKSASTLCELLKTRSKWREGQVILACVQSVSKADGLAGQCETDLIRYFTETLMQKR